MNTLRTGTIRIFLSLCLTGYSLPSTVWALDADADSARSAAGESTISAPIPSAGSTETTSGTNVNPSGVVMGGIVLPKSPLTMDFQDADIRDVLHLLALKSGLNIIYGADVVGSVTIHLDRVPFDQAFQTILTLKALVALPMGPRVI